MGIARQMLPISHRRQNKETETVKTVNFKNHYDGYQFTKKLHYIILLELSAAMAMLWI